VIIPDHYIFTSDPYAKRNVDILREFAREQNLPHYYDVGTERYKGVCHVALAEEGFTRPGEVLFGTDSHTSTAGAFGEFATGIGNTDAAFILGTGKLWVKVPETMKFIFEGELPPYIMAKDLILKIIGDIGVDGATYRAMEFAGTGIKALDMEGRMTLTNMAVEAGAKNGLIEPDEVTFSYLRTKIITVAVEPLSNDPDARYHSVHEYQSADLVPLVACPHSPDHTVPAWELRDTRIDRAYIGSCTGGKISDFIAAARIIKGNNLKADTYVVPATSEVSEALNTTKWDGQTLRQIFETAGAQIGPPSCAACLGGPPDTFGRLNGNEVCISTTNRNFPGRMGSKSSQVYLASPYTVAASAVAGKITDPRDYF
ncbi:MAG: 3-isopropylmalate dehydratase large subunit, partial [candidate division KSB1 bacterium]|nr:3-isopropylmalate dehydratase large subunit [candidate division KSB1 bacterium]